MIPAIATIIITILCFETLNINCDPLDTFETMYGP